MNRHGEKGTGEVFDFYMDEGGGITRNPGARYSAAVLKRLLSAELGLLADVEHDPAVLITRALAEEIKERGGLGHDGLAEAERLRDYPAVRERGKVIDADTRLVVVDRALASRLRSGHRVGFRTLLENSVQLWAHKIDELRLEALPGERELFVWPYEYEPDFLGYMAGALKLRDFFERGGAIV